MISLIFALSSILQPKFLHNTAVNINLSILSIFVFAVITYSPTLPLFGLLSFILGLLVHTSASMASSVP
jgi:hypothetical protein